MESLIPNSAEWDYVKGSDTSNSTSHLCTCMYMSAYYVLVCMYMHVQVPGTYVPTCMYQTSMCVADTYIHVHS